VENTDLNKFFVQRVPDTASDASALQFLLAIDFAKPSQTSIELCSLHILWILTKHSTAVARKNGLAT